MMITQGVKLMAFSFLMFPIAFSSLGVGVVFASYNIALSRNPLEKDDLFSTTMMAFALIESFVFLSALIAFAVFFAL